MREHNLCKPHHQYHIDMSVAIFWSPVGPIAFGISKDGISTKTGFCGFGERSYKGESSEILRYFGNYMIE